MLWPVVFPAKLTFLLSVSIVILLTIFAPYAKWKRGKTLGTSLALVTLLFIPSCSGIMWVVDMRRFGTFQYDEYSQVNDFRIERYLPTAAENITLHKYPMGHQARYTISETDLRDFLDALWDSYDGQSAISRDQLQDGRVIGPEAYADRFSELDWPPLGSVIELHSPVQGDGGGATYFLHVASQTAYHSAGYW